ncbi:MAG: single-stranded-DNA-specific exonuclease RecJ [Gammaproteobacteria bacterium]|nr:single-stranded-DNA-specific exonuclease RecJ [Gammaproteobacteria bacterium]
MNPQIHRRAALQEGNFSPAVPALLRRILAARQVFTDEELTLDMQQLLPPELLLGLNAAVQLLHEELQRQGRVLIVSDFDADGATSCVLAMRALRAMGFRHVDYIVPNRFEYGYGLTPEIVTLATQKQPDLLITVDNGISSIEGVRAAQALGMRVLITDHHLPGRELPAADAIVNPNQPDCSFPSKSLAGVGVVFYLMAALRSFLRERHWFAEQGLSEPNMAGFLDLVALGTVADVVALDRNNRILVNEGLKRIRQGRACVGILALLDLGKRRRETFVASDLGFAVGPRLNAAGRLDDMALGIECLLTDDPVAAAAMAAELDAMNQQRKAIEVEMRDQALRSIESMVFDETVIPAGMCMYNPEWHQGVIGILAARIKERMHRPVIAFADAGVNSDGEEEIKGSARSIAGLHIRDVLDTVATRNPGLVTRFGGHAMAAGLTLRKQDYPQFCTAFATEVAALLCAEDLQSLLLTDGDVSPADLTLSTAQMLRDNGPWGQNFPEPCFDGEFRVMQQRLLGDSHLKLVLCAPGNKRLTFDAIAFNVDRTRWPDNTARQVRLVYRLDINEYRGERTLQLMVEHIEKC